MVRRLFLSSFVMSDSVTVLPSSTAAAMTTVVRTTTTSSAFSVTNGTTHDQFHQHVSRTDPKRKTDDDRKQVRSFQLTIKMKKACTSMWEWASCDLQMLGSIREARSGEFVHGFLIACCGSVEMFSKLSDEYGGHEVLTCESGAPALKHVQRLLGAKAPVHV